MKHAAATLGSGNLRNAVALPDGEDLNEWVAVNSKDCFYIMCIDCSSYFLRKYTGLHFSLHLLDALSLMVHLKTLD